MDCLEARVEEDIVEGAVRHTSRGPLLAIHPAMRGVLDVLDRVAGASCTVLVTGESGTGKELAVAALHDASPRAKRPLVAVNCGAIAENLVESELFGHARGAFTGAISARQGLVASAEGGTLFLDEVGELPLAVQVKLLRLLQQREYTPVGESRALKADVRIVAATNRDLAREVKAGRFREDLYYRLNVIHVRLPALRERRSDIIPLARHFLRQTAERVGRPDVERFSIEAETRLAGRDWQGNVRELENVVERAVLLSPDAVVCEECIIGLQPSRAPRPVSVLAPAPALAAPAPAPAPARALSSFRAVAPQPDADSTAEVEIDLRAKVDAYENSLIRSALARHGNNKTKAAQSLGLHRTTFVEMLKRKQFPRAA
jgi:sigma-54 dependent transcriptional regulator, flagellar regulatory protein